MRRLIFLLLFAAAPGLAQTPTPVEKDFVIRDFRFQSGATLPEVRIHYRTIGTPQRDAAGQIRNAVLLLHGSSGDATQLLAASFSGGLFGAGQPLDTSKSVTGSWMPGLVYMVEELHGDVNEADDKGFTALHHAAERGDNDMILFLVAHGAKADAVARNGQTVADMANGPRQRIQPFPETIALYRDSSASFFGGPSTTAAPLKSTTRCASVRKPSHLRETAPWCLLRAACRVGLSRTGAFAPTHWRTARGGYWTTPSPI